MDNLRHPIVAGQFYPASKQECIEEINDCLTQAVEPANLPDAIIGGIVPHAGWVFSGATAIAVFNAIKKKADKVDTFILFGAAHYPVSRPSIYSKGSWQSPLGKIEVDSEFADEILKNSKSAIEDPKAHSSEHSIEVQIPFIQFLFPQAKIVPIITPPYKDSIEIGFQIAKIIKQTADKKIVFIGSTDLTHYGPRYGFNPAGSGQKGIDWAKNQNDMEFIKYVLNLDALKLLEHSASNCSACGAGAVAASAAAAKNLGKTKGWLLEHTSSSDIMKTKYNQSSTESVGYVGIVF